MKKIVILTLLGFGIWSLGFMENPAFGFSINLDPPSINLSIAAGQSKSGSIKLENAGQEIVNVSVYTEDWLYARDGSKNFKPAGSIKYSCSKWINVYPEKFELLPGKSQDVKYTITSPASASGGYVSVIFFDSKVAQDNSRKTSKIIFSGRVGTIVYLETENKSVKKGTISNLITSSPDQNKALDITLYLKNEGNTHLSAKGSVVIADNNGKVYGRADAGRVNALPGETAEKKITWYGNLAEGQYDVIATLDYGADDVSTFVKNISVKKTGSISDFAVKAVNKNSVKCYLKYENKGNTTLTVSGNIIFEDKNHKSVKKLAINKFIILPQSSRSVETYWKGSIPKGRYRAFLVLDASGSRQTDEKSFVKE